MRLPEGKRRDPILAVFFLATVAFNAIEGRVFWTILSAVIAVGYGFFAGLWMEQRKVNR